MAAGSLDHRVRFQRRTSNAGDAGGDAFGRPSGGWEDLVERWARVEAKTGAETFQGRVAGSQTFEILIRRDPETLTITNADRAFDVGPGRYFNIKTIADFPPDPDAFLLLTVSAGGANG